MAGGQAGLNPELVDGQIDRLEELFNPTTILHLEICLSGRLPQRYEGYTPQVDVPGRSTLRD